MTVRVAPSSDNLYLGRGVIYMDRLSSGVRTGEFHLGNCDKFSITSADENLDNYSKMVAEAPLYKRILKQRTITLAIEGFEFSTENLKAMMLAEDYSLTQSANSVSNAVLSNSVTTGRYYEVGYRDIANVVVYGNDVSMTVTDDYTVDADRGRIYIVPGGGIADGDRVNVDADYSAIVAGDLTAYAGGKTSNLEVFLRFVGDPTAGPAMEIQAWRCALSPNGELGFIADDYGKFSLSCAIQDESTNHPNAPYYLAIEL